MDKDCCLEVYLQGLGSFYGADGAIFAGGLGGGIGSTISGGNFFQGFGQGVAVGAFNHALHSGAEGIESALAEEDWPIIGSGGHLGKKISRILELMKDGNSFSKAFAKASWEFEGNATVDAAIIGSSFTGVGVGLGMLSRSTRIGTWAYNSKLLGYQSKLFGRYHSQFLPKGFPGYLNRYKLRIGWGTYKGRHVFRAAAGKPHTPNKWDILRDPKF